MSNDEFISDFPMARVLFNALNLAFWQGRLKPAIHVIATNEVALNAAKQLVAELATNEHIANRLGEDLTADELELVESLLP